MFSIMFQLGEKKNGFLYTWAGRVKVRSFYYLRPPRFHYLAETILPLHADSIRQDRVNGLSLRRLRLVHSAKTFSAARCLHLLDPQSIVVNFFFPGNNLHLAVNLYRAKVQKSTFASKELERGEEKVDSRCFPTGSCINSRSGFRGRPNGGRKTW